MTDNSNEPDDVKNPAAVLRHNKELMAELKQAQAELKAAQDTLTAAQGEAAQWRKRWHEIVVLAPLDAELEDVSFGPPKYLRAELIERGILKMQADAEGIERPAWFGIDGKPAKLDGGHWKFLADMNDDSISRMIRGSRTHGSGAQGSHPAPGAHATQVPPAEVKPQAPVLGLR